MAAHRRAAKGVRGSVVLRGELDPAVGHLLELNLTLALTTNPRTRKQLVRGSEHAQKLGPDVALRESEQHDQVSLGVSVEVAAHDPSAAEKFLHGVAAMRALPGLVVDEGLDRPSFRGRQARLRRSRGQGQQKEA